MSVPVQTPHKEYTGNGVTNNFALEFTCDSKQELKVFINDIEPELSTWSLVGGAVVFNTAPVSGSKIVLKRATKLERTTNYSSVNNSFRPDAINKDLDRIWYAIQEQNFKAGQYDYDYNFVLSQVRPITTGGTGADNPNDARNNLNIYSKEEVNALIATGGEGNVVGVSGGGTGATTAAGARTNLGVMSSSEVTAAINTAIPKATETALGVVELATQAETNTGTDDERAVTPKKMLAGLKNHLNASGNAPTYACRAWVNFNGTGTVAIRGSGNVSSITDNGVGDFTINFTTAIQDANYAIAGVTGNADVTANPAAASVRTQSREITTTSCRVRTANHFINSGAAVYDMPYNSVIIFR